MFTAHWQIEIHDGDEGRMKSVSFPIHLNETGLFIVDIGPS